ncbi:MAG: TraR/DksA C4-type zinc finger protein [Crocinitomicaceae bacterium]|nr:TraR/DksA C4-type zinc finger protein [Crocinitomicaceae bacterium]
MELKEKKEFEKIIQKKIVQLIKDIADLKESTQTLEPDCSIGRVSRMDAINNNSINQAALRKREEKLKGLEYALAHLYEEEFGKCSRCGNEIQKERILLMPESRFCVPCAKRG